jgi:hypothetical protein
MKEARRIHSQLKVVKEEEEDGEEDGDEEILRTLADSISKSFLLVDLPEGWEEGKDPNTNVTYYINTLTSQPQWERPTSPAVFVKDEVEERVKVIEDEDKLFSSLSLMSADSSMKEDGQISHRVALTAEERAASFVSNSYGSSDALDVDVHDVNAKEEKQADPEAVVLVLSETDGSAEAEEEDIPTYRDCARQGILQTLGGVMGLSWKKRFFALSGNVLSKYKSSQEFLSCAVPADTMTITSQTELSFTRQNLCIKIRTDKQVWTLMGENTESLKAWTNDIKFIIGQLFEERIKGVTKIHAKKGQKK